MDRQLGSSESRPDKRGRQPCVPIGYEALLTHDQRHRIDVCSNFGWELHFIRRPLFMAPTVVMIDGDRGNTWQIIDDGAVEPFHDIRVN